MREKKLSTKEIIKYLNPSNDHRYSYNQIKEAHRQLIESSAENDEIHAQMIDIVLDLYEQLEVREPSGAETEEWIEDKALVLLTISFGVDLVKNRAKVKEYKDFIRNLLKEYRELLRRQ